MSVILDVHDLHFMIVKVFAYSRYVGTRSIAHCTRCLIFYHLDVFNRMPVLEGVTVEATMDDLRDLRRFYAVLETRYAHEYGIIKVRGLELTCFVFLAWRFHLWVIF